VNLDREYSASRRALLRGGLFGSFALAAGPAMASVQRAVKYGRLRQSLTYWCLNTDWNWDIDRICLTGEDLGCESVELVPPEMWPAVRKHGLQSALAPNGMPDPPFHKGVNNPKYHDEVIARTKHAIDQASDFGFPNVITFIGYKWRDSEDPKSGEIRLQKAQPTQ
jgi:hypothetical protein